MRAAESGVVVVFRGVAGFDRALAWARPGYVWLGELAMAVLGTHLAADQLDDLLLALLDRWSLPFVSPDDGPFYAAWAAVVVELAVAAWATWALWRSFAASPPTKQHIKTHGSLELLLVPLFWIPVSLAGAWVAGMATEDLLVPWIGQWGTYLGWLAAAVCAVRLSASGVYAATMGVPAPSPKAKWPWSPGGRLRGWWLLPLLLPIAWLAARDGLPIWGWL